MTGEIWTEKYRPETLEDVVGHQAIKRTFRGYLQRGDMPNILLNGEPGVGKTALIHAFANEFYGDYKAENFLEKNASDDRTLALIRDTMRDYGDMAPGGPFEFKILYLGEIDGLPSLTQDALKRTMETNADVVRVVADCNNKDALIPAIQSRFVRITAHRPTAIQITAGLMRVCAGEKLILGNPLMNQIVASSGHDMRAAINLLQALPWDDGEDIPPQFVRDLAPSASKEWVVSLWSVVSKTADYKQRETAIIGALTASGWDALGILEILYDLIFTNENGNPSMRAQLLDCLGEYIYRLTQPCNKLIQFRCCITQLQLILGVA